MFYIYMCVSKLVFLISKLINLKVLDNVGWSVRPTWWDKTGLISSKVIIIKFNLIKERSLKAMFFWFGFFLVFYI